MVVIEVKEFAQKTNWFRKQSGMAKILLGCFMQSSILVIVTIIGNNLCECKNFIILQIIHRGCLSAKLLDHKNLLICNQGSLKPIVWNYGKLVINSIWASILRISLCRIHIWENEAWIERSMSIYTSRVYTKSGASCSSEMRQIL